MTRATKTSGFLGLTVVMGMGIYQAALLSGADPVPSWLSVTTATLGGLSVLAIVTGIVLEHREVDRRGRAVVTGLLLSGQWFLPATITVGDGFGVAAVTPTLFLWTGLLAGAMVGMAYVSARRVRSPPAPPAPDGQQSARPARDSPDSDVPEPPES
jgi:hypothetical protein